MDSQILENKVLQVTKTIEKQVDAALEKLENLDVNDIESLRKKRMQELKALEEKQRVWRQNGHGQYEELPEEKTFFDTIKKSERVIIHFYTNTNFRCKIVDKHLKILAAKHVETRFVSLNAEKCPFLAERLKIKVIPTIVCIKDTILIDKIVGFTSLGNRDDFTTDVLEWRLAQNEIINYEGDITLPPTEQNTKGKSNKSSIRDGKYNAESDDDLDIEDFSKEFELKNSKNNSDNILTREEEIELGLIEEDDQQNEKDN
ncbi:thioredoxin domain-containing protein 9 [Agrilus planipennis]|uniref:Thioredoxin domain-containing protein 9 n=1 Tax=Agrilus planipennis TaxID=224129 RepID=A0A1W4W4K4_AGRPL|nr:thioredoxin domain-containing protein 9 [Agrilus planipennis]